MKMELIFILSFLASLNCLNMPEFIGKPSSKKKIIRPYNTTKFNRYNITKRKNQWMPIIEDEGPDEDVRSNMDFKPVIYLYPEESMDVSVQLNFEKRVFTTIYPKFNGKNTWNVHAEPNGDIIIKGRKYPYLFWEAKSYAEQDLNEGFIVKDSDAQNFLEEKLSILGLNDKEKTDFITFWLPILLRNKLSLCSFQGQKYLNTIKLNITPKPDSLIRIFLSIKKLDSPINIKEQNLKSVERKGFTVVEWGGSIVNN